MELARVAREQLDCALDSLSTPNSHSGVHEARKRLKMLRAMLRLIRDPLGRRVYEADSMRLRAVGRRLSAVRDADVLVSTLDDVKRDFDGDAQAFVPQVRKRLRKNQASLRGSLNETVASVRSELRPTYARLDAWKLERVGLSDVVQGVTATYGRGRRAFRLAAADRADDALHEWRKRAKDLWYHLRLLREVWPPFIKSWINEAHRLADLLGDDHDLAVLMAAIESDEMSEPPGIFRLACGNIAPPGAASMITSGRLKQARRSPDATSP